MRARLISCILVLLSTAACVSGKGYGPSQPAPGSAIAHRDLNSLLAREAIRDKVQLYTLLHDGDGGPADTRAWANEIWTDDATFQVVNPDGTLMFADSPDGLHGREAIFNLFGRSDPSSPRPAIRHFLAEPVFDEVAPDKAKTRTIEIVIHGKAFGEAGSKAAGERGQSLISSYVFHDTWVRGTDGGWRKSRTIVYCTVSCPSFAPPASR